jgi:hypothetical protein
MSLRDTYVSIKTYQILPNESIEPYTTKASTKQLKLNLAPELLALTQLRNFMFIIG